MIIIGHKDIPSVSFCFISGIDEINSSSANSIVCFDYDIQLLKYCYDNDIKYAVKVNSIKEAIFSNSLDAMYILSNKDLATNLQSIAQTYMFDSKNIAIIEDEDMIEHLALKEVDGVMIV